MEIKITKHFTDGYQSLPDEVKRCATKQISLLIDNINHPSLRAKKMKGMRNIWEARITKDYRFTFQIEGNAYILRKIGKNEEVLRNP